MTSKENSVFWTPQDSCAYELTAVLAAGTRSAQGQAEQEQSQQEGRRKRWAQCPSRSCGAMVTYATGK